jgi:hypothetical protein
MSLNDESFHDQGPASFKAAKAARELVSDEQPGSPEASAEFDPHKLTEYQFVRCEHVPSMAPAVAEAVQGCNVLAIESVDPNSTIDEKRLKSEMLTAYLSSTVPTVYKAEIRNWFESHRFINAIMSELENTDKTIVLIDVVKGTPGYDELKAERDERLRDYKLAVSDYEPSNDLRDKLGARIAAGSKVLARRNTAMQSQIGTIAWTNKERQPQRVGVIIGAQHEIDSVFAEEGYRTSSELVVPDYMRSGDDIRLPYELQAERDGLNREVTEELLNRIVLTDSFGKFFNGVHATELLDLGIAVNSPANDNWDVEMMVVELLDDTEIPRILAQLDEFKTEIRGASMRVYDTEFEDNIKKARAFLRSVALEASRR